MELSFDSLKDLFGLAVGINFGVSGIFSLLRDPVQIKLEYLISARKRLDKFLLREDLGIQTRIDAQLEIDRVGSIISQFESCNDNEFSNLNIFLLSISLGFLSLFFVFYSVFRLDSSPTAVPLLISIACLLTSPISAIFSLHRRHALHKDFPRDRNSIESKFKALVFSKTT